MDRVGIRLRAIRQKYGFTLREVEERSSRLAQHWNDASYRISASWLDRVECESRDLSASKLIVIGTIYSLSAEDLLALYGQGTTDFALLPQIAQPNNTLLLTRGPLAEYAERLVPDSVLVEPVPEKTMLLPAEDYLPAQYRRGVIGKNDNVMEPMLKAGTLVMINTQRRAIAQRREWQTEYDRPIYLLFTRAGYVCGWCDLDRITNWLTLVPHYASYASSRRWKYRTEVEVVGRIAALMHRFEDPQAA